MNGKHDEDIELRDLRYIAACCEEGQLTAAARRLRVGQPTLSHALQRIERRLGEPLFERSPNRRLGVRPTAAGRALWARARQIQGCLAGLGEDLAALRGLVAGDLLIGSIQSLNASLLPGPLARFAAAHPGVSLTLRTLASEEVPEAVRDGRVELGFYASAARSAVRAEGVQTQVLAREEFVLLVRRDDPLAGEPAVALRRLADAPLVLVPPDTPSGQVLRQACRQAGFVPRVVLALESADALRETVRAGLGRTILPAGSLPPHDRDLRSVPLTDPTPRRDVFVATRPGAGLSRAAEAFLAEVRRGARK